MNFLTAQCRSHWALSGSNSWFTKWSRSLETKGCTYSEDMSTLASIVSASSLKADDTAKGDDVEASGASAAWKVNVLIPAASRLDRIAVFVSIRLSVVQVSVLPMTGTIFVSLERRRRTSISGGLIWWDAGKCQRSLKPSEKTFNLLG